MLFGACYYPEHWVKERWETDARMMKEAGFNVVRMAEFAWIKMEPAEGEFDFEWLDEAIALFSAYGIRTILGTPTAGPPKWLLDKHPDIYQRDYQGHVRGFGTRRSYCSNNATYRDYTRAIVTEMAKRYGSHPDVIGWQIDNELGAIDTARCYCDSCKTAFVGWLKRKYATLDRLNEEWGTIFSSQLFTAWEQVHLPAYSVHQGHNPGLVLDFRRFSSDSVRGYQALQIGILREHCPPAQPITTNLMGSFNDLDYYDLSADLDLVSLDIYPIMKKVPEERAFRTGINHDAMRGLKGMNYWVLEHQSGTPCTNTFSPTPKPGELRRWTYQSVARGADAIVYFRWRTLTYALEEYWHGILQHHGKPGRKYREVRQVGEELARLAPLLADTTVRSKAAIVKCFHNEWAFEIQPHASGFVYKDHQADYYRYFHDRNIQVDVISPDSAGFDGYDLLIVPNLMMSKEATVRAIHDYVRAGGTVVMDFRAGAKEWNNRMLPEILPGPFAGLLGIEVDDYGIIEPEHPVGLAFAEAFGNAGLAGQAATWYDVIEPIGASTVVRFTNDYFAGCPAVTRNEYGAGRAYYIGTELDRSTLNALFDGISAEAGLKPVLPSLPQGVEAVRREGDGRREVIFVINHNECEVSFAIEDGCVDLLTGRTIRGVTSLAANGILALERSNESISQ
ncbi:beta-galactosidase [Paenibacillus rhizovicinus]|uniref:Beta-galactosidase n=1 Tax=Paenibacillus rhizovicinus TaxID=2704463 RepID=A0A6C0P430_9BACL|nr:beta-galactosidase [Paenibacillus rhizovicinus]QHW33310.1 beta-galactosidase [Paenibacillus rhizovicinus]